MMLRSGLRNDDVLLLARAVRSGRDAGLGPDEAWAQAKRQVLDVEPEVLDNWREEIEKRAEAGHVGVTRTTTTNILARVSEQEEQLTNLKRRLADAGEKVEKQEFQLAELQGKYDALVSEAKAKLAMKDGEIERLNGEVERLTTPKKK